MKRVDDFRLRFGKQELVPIIIGGMGVDISTAELALEVARLGGIGHISDAMVNTVTDRRFDTKFVKEKLKHEKLHGKQKMFEDYAASEIVEEKPKLSSDLEKIKYFKN